MRASLPLTSPAYLVVWESQRQRDVSADVRDSDGSPGWDNCAVEEVWEKFSSAAVPPGCALLKLCLLQLQLDSSCLHALLA